MHSRNRLLLTAVAALTLALAPRFTLASSHSEAPGTARDRLADDTDLWAWVASDAPDYVTIVGGWVPLLEPNGGPNFYSFDDEAHYYINIDNVGDAQDHIRFEFTFKTTRANPNTFLYNTGVVTSFDDPDLNVRQLWTLTRTDNGHEEVLASDKPVAPNYVGPKSMPDYGTLAQSTLTTLSDGTKIFVGPRDDPFFADLAGIFDLLTIRKVPGNRGKGVDGLGGYDVMIIAMQVPKTRLTRDGRTPDSTNSVIGLYDSAERRATRTLNADGSVTLSGAEMQVSRLGNPLVNEAVIALKDKDKFNHTKPPGDGAFAGYVVDPELPKLFNLLYGLPIPATPRTDLVSVFLSGIPGLNKPNNPNQVLCEMLRLNMAIAPAANPNRFGVIAGDVAGFPNGRRLPDDVIDIAERVLAGGYVLTPMTNNAPANQLGDGVDFNDVPYLPYFPYAALPHNPFDHKHHPKAKKHKGDNDAVAPNGLDTGGDDVESPDVEIGDDTGAPAAAPSASLSFAGAHPADRSQLQFTLTGRSHVTLKVYDLQGRTVRTLVDQDAAAGTFHSSWDGRADDGSRAVKGVYFVRLATDTGLQEARKVTLE